MNCRGMTLLEVMVALPLLSVAALALLKTAGEQLHHFSYLEQRQLALWVADNQLARLALEAQWPAEGWHYGSEEMAREKWHWRWRGVTTSSPGLRALEIEVRLQPQSSRPLATLRTWRSKP